MTKFKFFLLLSILGILGVGCQKQGGLVINSNIDKVKTIRVLMNDLKFSDCKDTDKSHFRCTGTIEKNIVVTSTKKEIYFQFDTRDTTDTSSYSYSWEY